MYFPLLKYPLQLFACVGVDPRRGYTKLQICLFLLTFIIQWNIIYLIILYILYKEDLTIPDITTALESFLLNFQGTIKLVLLLVKKKELQDLLDRMNYFWKIEDTEDKEERQEYLQYMRFIKTVFLMYNSFCIGTTLSFTCRTFFLEGDYLTFTTPKPDWIPFHLMLFYEGMAFVLGIFTPIVGIDFVVLTLLLLTKMQFKMLNKEIGRIFKEPIKSEDDFNRKIKKCVDYHNFLLDYVSRINNTFSLCILVYVVMIVLSMCVEMYIVSTQNSLTASIKAVMYMTNGLCQYIICYCAPSQVLTDEAQQTTEYVYFNKWYEHLTPSVKIAQIMILRRAQKTVLILAGGIIKIDMEACLKTVQTMVSYAMFIRTMELEKTAKK